MQLADELPMIYTVCIMAFATFSYRRPAKVQALIAAALVGLAVFITVCTPPRCVFPLGGDSD
jgi:dihydroceramidase